MSSGWSDKHGARVDDELQDNEQGARNAGVDELGVDVEATDRPDVPLESSSAISIDEAEQRSRLAQLIEPSVFPADKATLLADARQNGNADDGELVALLQRLPDGETFETFSQAWDALGGHVEHRSGPT